MVVDLCGRLLSHVYVLHRVASFSPPDSPLHSFPPAPSLHHPGQPCSLSLSLFHGSVKFRTASRFHRKKRSVVTVARVLNYTNSYVSEIVARCTIHRLSILAIKNAFRVFHRYREPIVFALVLVFIYIGYIYIYIGAGVYYGKRARVDTDRSSANWFPVLMYILNEQASIRGYISAVRPSECTGGDVRGALQSQERNLFRSFFLV